jgi:Flp pilus assembly CpaF family ATPase
MKIWWNNLVDTERHVVETAGGRIRIGRAAKNDVVLNSPFVAEEAAVIYQRANAWELVALGLNEIHVGDRELYGGDRLLIETDEEIRIYPFTLTLDLPKREEATQDAVRRERDESMSRFLAEIHVELLRRMGPEVEYSRQTRISDEQMLRLEQNIEAIARDQGFFQSSNGEIITHTAGYTIRSEVLSGLAAHVRESKIDDVLFKGHEWSRFISAVPEREEELGKTARYVAKVLKLDDQVDLSSQIAAVEREFWDTWEKIEGDIHREFKAYLAGRYLRKQIKDIVFGYGPLEDLLRLPTISEIMVVDRDHIYVENAGVLENSGRRFISDAVTLAIIERIVSRVGRRIDKAQPLVDARLADGSRVNAVIPPIAVSGPCITIRRFPQRKLLIDDLVAKRGLTRTAAEFLRAAVLSRKNILISGGTGTGKTTLLNCLSDFIPDKERIVTIEDTAELQLNKQHVVRLETKQANVEGSGEFSIRELVRNALRMRPDRIVVGECRGAEALDMLQAMNTGHDGSLTTIHANSAEDVVLRLEVLVQMAADLPIDSIHRQVASAIDLIVQLHRMRNGRRCISQIAEVVGVDPRTRRVKTRDLYLLAVEGKDDSELAATGHLPTFMPELLERGILDLETFYQ